MFTKALALTFLMVLTSAAPTPSTAIIGTGILLDNAGTLSTEFCFFNNIANGDGTATPNFDSPEPCVQLPPGTSQFVSLPGTFKGRVQRGKLIPATWAEFQLDASDGAAHGDISVEQGMDGCATISSTDGSNQLGGFTKELVPLAPAAAKTVRQDGQTVIASTMGNWLAGPNSATVRFLESQIDPSKTYITGGSGVVDVSSKNQALKVTWC